MKLNTFFILETGLNNFTKQPLRWKFTQSHKQLSLLSPDLNCLRNMCGIANLFDTNIGKFDTKQQFLAENQMHRTLGSQNYLRLINKV